VRLRNSKKIRERVDLVPFSADSPEPEYAGVTPKLRHRERINKNAEPRENAHRSGLQTAVNDAEECDFG